MLISQKKTIKIWNKILYELAKFMGELNQIPISTSLKGKTRLLLNAIDHKKSILF